MTPEQRTILAAHIRANTDTDVIAALAGRNDTELTRLYNLDSIFIVWKEAVTTAEYREVMIWTEVDQLPAGKARVWEWITESMTKGVDATKSNVRAGIAEAFSATQTNAFLVIAKEAASVAQSVFATGTGTDGDPGIRDFTGNVTTTDIGRALNDNP